MITFPPAFVTRHSSKGLPLGLAGAALIIVGALLSWSYDPGILGNLSIAFNPAGLQIMAIAMTMICRPPGLKAIDRSPRIPGS